MPFTSIRTRWPEYAMPTQTITDLFSLRYFSTYPPDFNISPHITVLHVMFHMYIYSHVHVSNMYPHVGDTWKDYQDSFQVSPHHVWRGGICYNVGDKLKRAFASFRAHNWGPYFSYFSPHLNLASLPTTTIDLLVNVNFDQSFFPRSPDFYTI